MELNNKNFEVYDNDNNYKLYEILDGVSEEQRVYMLTLYKLYSKFTKALGKEDIDAKLSRLEDKVYTVNARVLGNKDRINLEMRRIRQLDVDAKKAHLVNDVLQEITDIMSIKDWDNIEVINYIKERLLYLQIMLKLDITFISVVNMSYKKNFVFGFNKKGKKKEK